MTLPAIALPNYSEKILAAFQRMEVRNASRDRNHEILHQVRRGNIRQLFPAELEFSITFNGSPIANFVDIVAHDMAEGIAPLPALACVSGKMETDADQKRAERKNRIGDHFWRNSKLEAQMLKKGADWFVSYGFLPLFVEPDVNRKMPRILLIDPRKSYYELDRYGDTVQFAHTWLKSVDELCAMFPEYKTIIRYNPIERRDDAGSTELNYVLWVDQTQVCLFLPQRGGLVLDSYEHRMSKCPVVIAERPGEDDTPRGQFDDVIWVQVARSIMATLALEAASLAVQAPIAIPDDVDEVPVGPNALIPSKDAQAIHRVDIQVPATVFAETANLDNELRTGSRYPEARSGGVNASVITGKGVEALLGTFDSQIKGAQIIFTAALEEVTALCFEMDETWWPNKVQTIQGTTSGASYEFDYTPSKDIAGRYGCKVTYGFAAGLRDPSQAIVTMLQLEGAGLIAKGTTMANLPLPIDPLQEMKRINVEGSRDALKQGFFSLVQASGQMAAQGQDPGPVITMAVDAIRAMQNGQPVEDAIAAAYQAMEQAQQEAQQAAQEAAMQQAQAAGAGPGGPPGAPGGPGPSPNDEGGLLQGHPSGQAGLPAGGRPALQEMVAGFRGNGNLPVDQFTIRRAVPTGTA